MSRRSSTPPSTSSVEVGYDRLTMDAVATAAKASKATLYRRWSGKAEPGRRRSGHAPRLVDASRARHRHPARRPARDVLRRRRPDRRARPPPSPASSPRSAATRSSPTRSASDVHRPQDRGVAPRSSSGPSARGELRADVDLDLLAPALAGIVLHRTFVLGAEPDRTHHRARVHRPDHPARRSCTRPPAPSAATTRTRARPKEPHDRRPRAPTATERAPGEAAAPGLGPGAHLASRS